MPSAKSFQSKKKPFPFLVAPKHSQVEPSLPTDLTTQTVPTIGFSIKTPLAKSSLSRKSPFIISDYPKHMKHLTELSAEADQVTVYKTKMSKPTIDNHATKVDLTPFIGTNPYCKQQSTGEGELTKSSSPWNLDLASNHFHLHPHNLEDSAQLEMGTTASQGAMGHTITKAMSWTGKPANQRANSVKCFICFGLSEIISGDFLDKDDFAKGVFIEKPIACESFNRAFSGGRSSDSVQNNDEQADNRQSCNKS